MKNLFKTGLFAALFVLSCGKENAHKCCSEPPVYEKFGDAVLFIPNIFTPNFDGINDVFAIDGPGIKSLTITIKKDGALVFQTAKPFTELWDASAAAAGKYTFTYQAQANDGTTKTGSGEVCLVRDEQVKNCTSCAFPNQFDGSDYDPDLPNDEAICD